jgi:hypothetical protein
MVTSLRARRTASLIARQSAIVRAIQTNLAHRAGLTASTGTRTGVVTLIQHFAADLVIKYQCVACASAAAGFLSERAAFD